MTHVQIIILILLCTVNQLAQGRVAADQSYVFGESSFFDALDWGSGNGEIIKTLNPSCTPEYAKVEGHTMCMTDDSRVTRSGVSNAQKQEIIAFHNKVRANVQPVASDLTKMIWDDNLAAVADKWAKQCIVDHDLHRDIPSYGMFIGQNVGAGYREWKGAMKGWLDEVELYHYGQNAVDYLGAKGWKKIGHYTQLVQNTTHRVGCGYAECRNTDYGRFYVCNYAKGQSRTQYPYTSGQQCGACPLSCKNNLCDCGGMICLNGGQLDVNTCTCTCQSIYTGADCGELNCPPSDAFYCARDLLPRDCAIYSNVPVLCPYMCGLCGSQGHEHVVDVAHVTKTVTPSTTPDPVYVSAHNCTYRGMRSGPGECKNYGDKGSDTQFCESEGGKFTCNDCERYFNVKRDYCPVMCGLCDAPCGGKKCMNGGHLDTDSCLCSCDPPFEGDLCEILACPVADKWHCQFFTHSYCSAYINVPHDCPHLCGICAD